MIINYDALALSRKRRDALGIIMRGVDAVLPARAMEKVHLKDDTLVIISDREYAYQISSFRRIIVFAVGKASLEMAGYMHNLLGDKIADGVIITPAPAPESIGNLRVFRGTHPLPSRGNITASEEIVRISKGLTSGDLVLFLVSGGGSSLFTVPVIPIEELRELNRFLLKCGADINEVNTIRKHLSRVKGGNFLRIAYPAKVVSIALSDVVGNFPSVIASGPTVRDETGINDAERIIEKYNLPLDGSLLVETPKDERYFSNADFHLLLTNRDALNAMLEESRRLGYTARILSSAIRGEAEKVADMLIEEADASEEDCLIGGGETTVNVKGKGKGGRNQHLALAALLNSGLGGKTLVSFASDGADNSDYAGAIADSITIKHAGEKNLNIGGFLENNDSYSFFGLSGDAIVTGLTGTNVADLFLVIK